MSVKEPAVLKTFETCCNNTSIYEITYNHIEKTWLICNDCLDLEFFKTGIKNQVRIKSWENVMVLLVDKIESTLDLEVKDTLMVPNSAPLVANLWKLTDIDANAVDLKLDVNRILDDGKNHNVLEVLEFED